MCVEKQEHNLKLGVMKGVQGVWLISLNSETFILEEGEQSFKSIRKPCYVIILPLTPLI